MKHSNSILLPRFPIYTVHVNLENENKRIYFHKKGALRF